MELILLKIIKNIIKDFKLRLFAAFFCFMDVEMWWRWMGDIYACTGWSGRFLTHQPPPISNGKHFQNYKVFPENLEMVPMWKISLWYEEFICSWPWFSPGGDQERAWSSPCKRILQLQSVCLYLQRLRQRNMYS